MRIDWGALLPADRAADPQPAQPVHTSASEAAEAGAAIDAEREAWEERAGDDRRLCLECGNYQDRRCTIARPGGLVSAARGYMPVSDMLRRCEGFAPLPDDPDQRPGVQRWPGMLRG